MLRIRLDRFCLGSLGILAFGTLQDWLVLQDSPSRRASPVTGRYDAEHRDRLVLDFSSSLLFDFFFPSRPCHGHREEVSPHRPDAASVAVTSLDFSVLFIIGRGWRLHALLRRFDDLITKGSRDDTVILPSRPWALLIPCSK